MIKLERAKRLGHGDIVYHKVYRNADNTPKRFKVNGVPKTLKKDKTFIRVPLKHGLYDYAFLVNAPNYFDNNGKEHISLGMVTLDENKAMEGIK